MKEVHAKYCMRPGLPKDLIKQYHCAVGTNQSSCHGDSGSTNFIKNKGKFYALGITSHGTLDTCNPTWPITFAKVIYFKKWIQKHVKDLPKP
ncbi:tryptase beta-2 [Trichonephila clavata]|uniref:Tryptase beta-2 n=1 Tax=Trichonephila clavata TaxID=2740835 RepID=A0A8X6GDD6_TRICU|nr:tryptase beta-2 [Trichonephila clavata]